MALSDEFEKAGNWLFRWRSYVPLIIIAMFLIALREFSDPNHSLRVEEAICFFVSFLGLGVRIFTVGHTPKGTSGRNTKKQVAETLNTDGIYSVVRNPLYLGNFLMGLGIALYVSWWWPTLIYTLIFWLYYERIIFAEEAFLKKKFGQQYLDWAEKTPVFIPEFTHYQQANLPFSLKNALKREYNGFFAVVSVMFSLEIIGDIYHQGQFDGDSAWIPLVLISFVAWVTLRFLKKHTNILDVEGR